MENTGMQFHLWITVSFHGSHRLTSFPHQFLTDGMEVNYSGWVSLDRANTAAGGESCLETQRGENRRLFYTSPEKGTSHFLSPRLRYCPTAVNDYFLLK